MCFRLRLRAWSNGAGAVRLPVHSEAHGGLRRDQEAKQLKSVPRAEVDLRHWHRGTLGKGGWSS